MAKESLVVRAPGRTELAGNHTDHQGGHVIAAALDCYAKGVFTPSSDAVVRVVSTGHETIEIALNESLEPRASEEDRSPSLVRGLVAQFKERGFELSGFEAACSNEVATGSGLSSSAAFELMLARAMNEFWAEASLSATELAIMSQRAEREWYGKPCGLMDQAASALGGIQHMSFACPGTIDAKELDFSFEEASYGICLVAVGKGHADLTDEYAAIPFEMNSAAEFLGKERLADSSEEELLDALPHLRKALGDRPALRALHFFREEKLVAERAKALSAGDIEAFLEATRLSGASSAMYLQNVSHGVKEQGAMLALALSDELLKSRGAARIHGGGFGGTIQAFVPLEETPRYMKAMDAVFGSGSAKLYNVVREGASATWK